MRDIGFLGIQGWLRHHLAFGCFSMLLILYITYNMPPGLDSQLDSNGQEVCSHIWVAPICCPRSIGGGRGRKDQTRPGRVQLEAGQRGLRGCSYLSAKTKTKTKRPQRLFFPSCKGKDTRQGQRGLRGCSKIYLQSVSHKRQFST